MQLLQAFAMTGWRLGFLAALKHFVAACGNIQRVAACGNIKYPKPGDDGFLASIASSFCPLMMRVSMK